MKSCPRFESLNYSLVFTCKWDIFGTFDFRKVESGSWKVLLEKFCRSEMILVFIMMHKWSRLGSNLIQIIEISIVIFFFFLHSSLFLISSLFDYNFQRLSRSQMEMLKKQLKMKSPWIFHTQNFNLSKRAQNDIKLIVKKKTLQGKSFNWIEFREKIIGQGLKFQFFNCLDFFS